MFAFFYLLCLLSCSDYLIKSSDSDNNLLMIYPDVLDFGHIEVNNESGQDSFGVINAGDYTITITTPALDLNEKFDLDEDLENDYEIEPGEFLSFNVYYNPITFEDNYDLITVETERGETYDLPIVGWGDAPIIEVVPDEADFGEVNVSCETALPLTIKNNGNLPLLINEVSQMVSAPQDITIDYGTLPNLPWEILPNQQVDFFIKYYPLDIGFDESKLTIVSSDPLSPETEVFQSGWGQIDYIYTDTFIQEETSVLDIIFVVDNSGSMRMLQNQLASQISSFLSVLINISADYHIGIITTDSEVFVAYNGLDWIDSSYQDPSLWMTSVINSIGVGGSAFEMGVRQAYLALDSHAAPGTLFWRDSSILSVIYISDEPDVSVPGHMSYFNFFDNLKAPDYHRHYAVIGDFPSGCSYIGPNIYRNINFGAGYYEMTKRYSGEWYSICASDWGLQLQNLASNLASRNRFQLNESDPIESSVVVKVNGQVVWDWSYDQSNNSVVFDNGFVPSEGQTITIEYAVWRC